MRFEDVARRIDGVPFMPRPTGRRIYDHLRSVDARDVLELGTAHGVSAAYMAAAVAANGGGCVTTVDGNYFADPTPQELLEHAGLSDVVQLVHVDDSSYNWWLKEQIERHSDSSGNCEPQYDFCYLDGAHDLVVDGFAAILVERLLRPGSWLVLDDLSWTFANSPWAKPEMSERELLEPHMRAVFELVLRPHPSFSEFVVEDDQWGWAKKEPAQVKRYRVRSTNRWYEPPLERLGLLRGTGLADRARAFAKLQRGRLNRRVRRRSH